MKDWEAVGHQLREQSRDLLTRILRRPPERSRSPFSTFLKGKFTPIKRGRGRRRARHRLEEQAVRFYFIWKMGNRERGINDRACSKKMKELSCYFIVECAGQGDAEAMIRNLRKHLTKDPPILYRRRGLF